MLVFFLERRVTLHVVWLDRVSHTIGYGACDFFVDKGFVLSFNDL